MDKEEKTLAALVRQSDGQYRIDGEFGGDRVFKDPYQAAQRLVLGLAALMDEEYRDEVYGHLLVMKFSEEEKEAKKKNLSASND